MSLFSEYGVDVAAGESGKWVRDTFRGDVGVKIRSNKSAAARAAQEKINKRNLKYARRGAEVPPAVQEKNATELACALVADWENVTDDKGAPVPPTDDGKQLILGDPRLSEFRDTIIGLGVSSDTFRADVEADAENLSNASALSSTPGAQQDTPAA